MAKRRRNVPESNQDSSPAWMTTYSDMVTLLLAFFILMYAYSVVDAQRFQQVLSSIQASFLGGSSGILENPPAPPPQGETTEDSLLPETEQILLTFAAIKQYLAEEGLSTEISPRLEERGIVLEIKENILFASGQATIRGEALTLLAKVGGIIKSVPNQIIVEGHTDNVPIQTARYPSNWELSADRAVNVIRYFIDRQHLTPARFLATGYGEYQPVADNATAAGRARNRRVNIVISEVNLLDKGVEEFGR